ncbi:YncE family protein [Olivibacter sp. XZL3]|uniref:YncE family protein n=1 Tax=Olivibacter sp. XZL3 TaxID=1735116 RepID=UPI001066135F|nr:hypothetical protein [Olivibacter sp. XZL3]
MKTKFNSLYLSLLAGALLTLGACSKNDDDDVTPTMPIAENAGYFILNEGSSLNSSLSFYNLSTGNYTNNVYSNLGTGANDLITYGTKLYVSVTNANKVVVLDSETKQELGTVNISLPRNLLSYRGRVYATGQGNNELVAIDTTTFSTTSVAVGNSPEQLAATGGNIYVANSGWREKLDGGDYDNTISVVNASSLTVTGSIEVAENLVAIAADSVRNTLYVNANATYEGVTETNPSKLYVVNLSNNQITPMTFGAEQIIVIPMTQTTSQAFLISTNFNNNTSGKGQLLTMDTGSQTVQTFGQSGLAIDNAYSIDFLPQLSAIVVGDAKDYTSNGTMSLFEYYNGAWVGTGSLEVGVSPKAFAFYYPNYQ